MGTMRLGDGVEISEEAFRKACSVAMRDHKEKMYTTEKHLNSVVIFGFPASWDVKDWISKGPFGNTKGYSPLFPSLKYLGLDEIATVNEAFLERFKEVLDEGSFKQKVKDAVTQKKQVLFTGHSSGGAIAILATVWFLEECNIRTEQNIVPPLCVTFGSPLVGDRIMSHALGRENWSRFFIHYVNRYDIVPRTSLAPLSLLEKHLQRVLNYFNPKHLNHKKELPSELAQEFYESVIKYASSVASHAACKIMGSTNGLLETLCRFIEMSPYRPFGTYIFDTGNKKLVISNPDAILQVLFYSSQLSNANELTEIAKTSLKDHLNYKGRVGSLQWRSAIVLDQELLGALPLSSGAANVNSTVSEALDDMGLSVEARLCLRAAAEWERQKIMNQNTIDQKKTEIITGIQKLEAYKRKCELRKKCYYDAFKASDNEDDFQANVARLELAGIWDELVELLKRLELPDKFEVQKEWIDLGTRYRRIAEPLDIANYYRHLKNEDTGPYMGRGRPKRYKCTQKWRDHALRKPSDLPGSCFWAEVEELCRGTGNLGNEEKFLKVYNQLEGWIQDNELGRDVCFDNSTFQKLLVSHYLRK